MKYIDLISHDSIVDSLLCKVTGTYEKKILTEFFEKKLVILHDTVTKQFFSV